MLAEGGALPQRLEPRSTVTACCDTSKPLLSHPIQCAYALTACGVTRTGTSPALKQVIRGAES